MLAGLIPHVLTDLVDRSAQGCGTRQLVLVVALSTGAGGIKTPNFVEVRLQRRFNFGSRDYCVFRGGAAGNLGNE